MPCGRSKYSIPFQLDCVPRKVFQSNCTSSPSLAKNPWSSATESLRPIPLGATLMRCNSPLSSFPHSLGVKSLTPTDFSLTPVMKPVSPVDFSLSATDFLVSPLAKTVTPIDFSLTTAEAIRRLLCRQGSPLFSRLRKMLRKGKLHCRGGNSTSAGFGCGSVDFECLRIDDYAVIPGSGLYADVTLQHVLPDTIGVAV